MSGHRCPSSGAAEPALAAFGHVGGAEGFQGAALGFSATTRAVARAKNYWQMQRRCATGPTSRGKLSYESIFVLTVIGWPARQGSGPSQAGAAVVEYPHHSTAVESPHSTVMCSTVAERVCVDVPALYGRRTPAKNSACADIHGRSCAFGERRVRQCQQDKRMLRDNLPARSSWQMENRL